MGAVPSLDVDLAAKGMDSVTVSIQFDGQVEDLLAFTRTLQSRSAWPGAQLQYELADHLMYGVGMKLRGAAITDITIDETLGQVEPVEGGGLCFRTAQRVTWPDGHADGFTEYRFLAGSATSALNTLEFSYSYAPPPSKLVKSKHLPEFKQGMQAVSARYVANLVRAVADKN